MQKEAGGARKCPGRGQSSLVAVGWTEQAPLRYAIASVPTLAQAASHLPYRTSLWRPKAGRQNERAQAIRPVGESRFGSFQRSPRATPGCPRLTQRHRADRLRVVEYVRRHKHGQERQRKARRHTGARPTGTARATRKPSAPAARATTGEAAAAPEAAEAAKRPRGRMIRPWWEDRKSVV